MSNTPTPHRRPFYTEFAWAFDLLIDRPVAKECGVIVTWLTERGVRPGAALLDAGCGTGGALLSSLAGATSFTGSMRRRN